LLTVLFNISLLTIKTTIEGKDHSTEVFLLCSRYLHVESIQKSNFALFVEGPPATNKHVYVKLQMK